MNKLFRPKCLRRVLLCLALLFPIVYLCGGLFFALAGSHGNQLFSEVNQDSYTLNENSVNRTAYDSNGNFYSWNIVSTSPKIQIKENNQYILISIDTLNTINGIFFTYWTNEGSFLQRDFIQSITLPFNIPLNGNIFTIGFASTSDFPVGVTPFTLNINGSVALETNYSNYLFSQPFANNNFVTSLGKDLVDGSTKGFAPMNDLFRFINSNMLHFESTDGLAMFGLGYVYYAVNVLIIYEILILAVKLIMLPLKAVDVFDKEDM